MGLPEKITTVWLVANLIAGVVIPLCVGVGLFFLVLPFIIAATNT